MSLFSFLFQKRGGLKREGTLTTFDRQTVREGWVRIEEQIKLGKPSNFRSAVIDADKLVDFVLRKMYPEEETMAERLKSVKPKFIKHYDLYDGLWFSHKIRNEIVHNVNFELPSVQATDILVKFKAGLDHLGIY